jgi:chemotaxis protein CheZ
MASVDDLEALFEAESASFQRTVQTASPLTALEQPAAGNLEKYYQAVSGLYVQEQAAPGVAVVEQSQSLAADGDSLYERLGGIVRQLHDSLRELGVDKSLSEATAQMVDAKDRLEYIATLTEQSAVKVLNTLEDGMPAQDALIKQGREMEARWAMLFAGKIGIDDFKVLAADARRFSASVADEGEKEKARLLEIMMAQDFQDLTGQIIKKVVGVTKNIEQELAKLLLENAPVAVKEKHVELMAGPAVPGTALRQDDVDDLLGDLGF